MAKKRSFSLIEVIVCLGLVTVLMSTLFFWYHTSSKEKIALITLKAALMEERYAHQRLENILPKSELPFFLSQEDNSLVFIFDRGTYFIPQLSGKVLGKLYFDPSSECLCLGIWPYPKQEEPPTYPVQHCVLLDGVTQCKFKFYSPPDLFKKNVDPDRVGDPHPKEGSQDSWLLAYKTMPALIKMHITRSQDKGINEHVFEWSFDLPSPILFPPEGVS